MYTLKYGLKNKKLGSFLAVMFAIFTLMASFGIGNSAQGNSITTAVSSTFNIPKWVVGIALVICVGAVVLGGIKSISKVSSVLVPAMAVFYIIAGIVVVCINYKNVPDGIANIFSMAFGAKPVAGGLVGTVTASMMNSMRYGIARGVFSNEAGSGSAPCAAAAADGKRPETVGMVQSLGVLIDTIVICTCTAMIMLLAPESVTKGKQGMDLLQSAMNYHLGSFGTIFVAVILFLFSFSTFIGILFYARSNVAYLCGNNWWSQTLYKIIALIMLFIGGLQAYTIVWDLGDVGIGLMTIINLIILIPMSKEAISLLDKKE